MVAIAADDVEDMAALQTRVPQIRLLSDPEARAAGAWGVLLPGAEHPIPTTFVVDRGRVVRWRHLPDARGDWPTYDEVARAVAIRSAAR